MNIAKKVPLEKIVEDLESGGRPIGGIVVGHGEVFSIGAEHLNDYGSFNLTKERRISMKFFQEMKRGIVRPNDILIVKDGATTGKTSFMPENFSELPCLINEHVFRLSVKPDLADSKYVFYYLYSPEGNHDVMLDFRGATIGGISQEFVKKVRIPLPPLPEQQRIVDILDKADRLRRLRRFALELGESYLQSVFLEMFGDPVTNPMGWETSSISGLGKVQTGNTPSRKEPENYGDYIEWIKSDNIIDGKIYVEKSREMLSERGFKKGRFVEFNSVLVTCIAGSPTSIGNVALTNRKVAFNQQINAVSPYDDVNPIFLYGLLRVSKPLVQRSTTLGMKRIITKSKFEKLLLIKPPHELQEKFANVIISSTRLRSQQREATRQAEHLFQSLMVWAFEEGQL